MIHLIDNYYLDADEQQFILTEWDGSFSKKQNKDGTFSKEWKSQRFYRKVEDLLEKLTTLYLRKAIKEATTFEELNVKIKEIKDMIKEVGRKIGENDTDAV